MKLNKVEPNTNENTIEKEQQFFVMLTQDCNSVAKEQNG